jgi:Protein of unknown function (DUF1622)
MCLLLGLEFELAADIIASVISPTWQDIGQLGAIAVIRTFPQLLSREGPRSRTGTIMTHSPSRHDLVGMRLASQRPWLAACPRQSAVPAGCCGGKKS